MRILVDHLGFEPGKEKFAIAQATEMGESGEAMRFILRAVDDGSVAFEGKSGAALEVPGWKGRKFWKLDFTALDREGEYTLQIERPGALVSSGIFRVATGLLQERTLSDILFYFKSQRCSGIYDRYDRGVSFFGGREGRVDVHGGWYDASGDYSKYLSHLSYANFVNPQQTPLVVWTLLEGGARLEQWNPRLAANLGNRLLEEAAHGADFLVRMQDPEGYFYTTVFDRWSKDIEQREICSYSTQKGFKNERYAAGFRQGGGMAVAALARAAQAGISGDYGPEKYREVAETGYKYLCSHNEELLDDGMENIIDDYCALLAATEIANLTSDPKYRDGAEERGRKLAQRLVQAGDAPAWWRAGGDESRSFFHASDAGLPSAALFRFLEVWREKGGGDESAQQAQEAALRSLEAELARTRDASNPFGLARQFLRLNGRPERTAFFIPHDNGTGYWWQGENARLASLASVALYASAAGLKTRCGKEDLLGYGLDQLHWILGRNPFDTCMMHGIGRNNPTYEEGYDNAPGGIVNGITSGFEDEEDIAFLPEPVARQGIHRWRWSEQWIPHAAWFFLAACSIPSEKQ